MLTQQVGFVKDDEGVDARHVRCDEIAVNQIGMGLRFRCEHYGNEVDIGGYRLKLTSGVRSFKFGSSFQLTCNVGACLLVRPKHSVAGDQMGEIWSQVTGMCFSIIRSDNRCFAIARNDHAFEVITESGTSDLAPLCCIFFNAPSLLVCQSSISHQVSVPCQLAKRCSLLC